MSALLVVPAVRVEAPTCSAGGLGQDRSTGRSVGRMDSVHSVHVVRWLFCVCRLCCRSRYARDALEDCRLIAVRTDRGREACGGDSIRAGRRSERQCQALTHAADSRPWSLPPSPLTSRRRSPAIHNPARQRILNPATIL